jgi:hypothetical protein
MGKHQDNFWELIKVGKRDLFASRFYQLFKSALMLLVLLFFLTRLEEKHILPKLVFQSIGTSIIVLTLTVVWDRMKSSRHYRNLCMALAIELFFVYVELLMCSEGFPIEKVAIKIDTWKEIKLTLAQYMPTFWYQKLFALYKDLEEINNENPLVCSKKILSAKALIEQCYPIITSIAKGSTALPLESAVEYISQQTYEANNR